MSIRLFGVFGVGTQSGKTTATNQIAATKSPMVVVPMAYTLKRMLMVLLHDLGLSDSEAEARIYGHMKEEPIDILGGKTCRDLMQTLGTEWGRSMVSDDLWVKCWEKRIHDIWHDAYADVACDDIRFENEAEKIRKYGGKVVMVRGEVGAEEAQKHASEGRLSEKDADVVIENDGTIEDLRSRIIAAVVKLEAEASGG